MSAGKLKTAVLGLNGDGQLLLKAASQIEHFEIQAVADKKTELAEREAGQYGCSAYDDYRQLIIQNQFDCLLVAAGIHSCDEYLRTAIKKKFNILKSAPVARNFEEAAEFVYLAEEENVKFAIANPCRFSDSFLVLRQLIGEPTEETKRAAEPVLITAVCTIGEAPGGNSGSNKLEPALSAWQSDPKLAGGGVLLHDCYDIIDQIIWNFGIPQSVYSLNTNQAADRQQRLYLTEDTAVLTMRFTDACFGNLIASRAFGPEQKLIKIYYKDKILTAGESQFTVSDNAGENEEKFEYDQDELDAIAKLLENFAEGVISGDEKKLCSSGRENLKNMAVIESAYLSARTSLPEEPARILEMPQLTSL